MPCVTPLRIAVALDRCPAPVLPALAAEAQRVALDFISVAPGHGVIASAAAPRIGVLEALPDDARRLRHAPGTAAALTALVVASGAPTESCSGVDLLIVADPAEVRQAPASAAKLVFADVRLGAGDLTGPATAIARTLQARRRSGPDGYRVVVGDAAELEMLTRGVVPALLVDDAFRRGYDARTLRGVLGLPPLRPASTDHGTAA